LVIIYPTYPEAEGKSLEELDEILDGEKHADLPEVMDVMKASEQGLLKDQAVMVYVQQHTCSSNERDGPVDNWGCSPMLWIF